MRFSYGRATRRLFTLIFAAVALGLVSAQGAFASSQNIQSSGPLANIWIGDDLRCQVQRQGEDLYEFYNPSNNAGNCGTILSVNGPAGATPQSYGGIEASNTYTLVDQSAVTGSGTSGDPYTVTTTEDAGSTGLRVTEVDRYTVGNDYYRTDVTVANNGQAPATGKLFHAADCYLQGQDTGFGWADDSSRAVACTQTPNNSPPQLIEEFAPITRGANYYEAGFDVVWSAVGTQNDFPNTADRNGDPNNPGTAEDNGMGVNWDFALSPGESTTFSLLSNFSESGVVIPGAHAISATGGKSFSGQAPLTVNNTVAAFTDSDPQTTASEYAASIDWGDGTTSAGTITGSAGNFAVSGNHTYGTPGHYTIGITVTDSTGTTAPASATDSADVTAPPSSVSTGSPAGANSSTAAFSGTANPNGLPTTGYWQYGLDPSQRGPGYTGPLYDQQTPSQSVGSDHSNHTIATFVGNLLPNSLYHVRFVSVNGAGTSFGPDQTFRTPAAKPPSPTVGKTGNFSPAGGTVFVLVNGKFVKLSSVQQLPSGTVVDALHGTLQLTTAAGQKGKKYTGSFGGAVFKVTQVGKGKDKGLTTLSIVEGAFKGAPSYAACTAKKAALAPRAISNRVLQSLRAKASGRFRTRGRYAAATVRGTKWTTVDRCDGTLISVQQHSVFVTDLNRHMTRLITAGHSYLAKAPKGRHK